MEPIMDLDSLKTWLTHKHCGLCDEARATLYLCIKRFETENLSLKDALRRREAQVEEMREALIKVQRLANMALDDLILGGDAISA